MTMRKIGNKYITVEHISSIELGCDEAAKFGMEEAFEGTIAISLLGGEPMHIILGSKKAAELEVDRLLRLVSDRPPV